MTSAPQLLYGIRGTLFQASNGSPTPFIRGQLVSCHTETANPHIATLPLIPLLPPPVNPLSSKYDSKPLISPLFSPPPAYLPRTHETCMTCRHRNNITSPCKLSCIGLLHIGHSVFALGQFFINTQKIEQEKTHTS